MKTVKKPLAVIIALSMLLSTFIIGTAFNASATTATTGTTSTSPPTYNDMVTASTTVAGVKTVIYNFDNGAGTWLSGGTLNTNTTHCNPATGSTRSCQVAATGVLKILFGDNDAFGDQLG